MRRAPILLLGVAIAAMSSAGAVFAFQKEAPSGRGESAVASRTAGSVLGYEPPGLDARMARAEKNGPYSLACKAGTGSHLICDSVRDEDVIPALRRGQTIYGRTVLGFTGPRGADPRKDSKLPTFEASDLVCGASSKQALDCLPVTAATPTVRAGQRTFVFYKKHNVTFTEQGRTIGVAATPTIPLRVLPGS
jgi:hypothetical protein